MPTKARASCESAEGRPVLLLRNHGPVTIGATLPQALALMWTVSRACEVQLAMQGDGRGDADSARGAREVRRRRAPVQSEVRRRRRTRSPRCSGWSTARTRATGCSAARRRVGRRRPSALAARLATSSFSIASALSAPARWLPSSNTRPGVPLMRCFLPKREVALQRAGVAVRGCSATGVPLIIQSRQALVLSFAHQICLRLLGRVGAEDRIEEGVDGDVLDLLQVALELLAVAAVRVGEDDELALAGALLPDDRVLQRQRLEVDRGELGDALLGEVDARLGVDQLAFDQVAAVLVGVEDVGADRGARRCPGSAVFGTSSIFGKSGSRSAMFLRIAASSAKAAEAKQAARRRAATARRRSFMMMLSGVERPRGEPALERRDPIDEGQAIVAEFADRRRCPRRTNAAIRR